MIQYSTRVSSWIILRLALVVTAGRVLEIFLQLNSRRLMLQLLLLFGIGLNINNMASAQVLTQSDNTPSNVASPTIGTNKLPNDLSALPLRREAESASSAEGMGSFQILTAILLVALFVGVVVWRRRHVHMSERPVGIRQWLRWLSPPIQSGALRLMQSTRLTSSASVHVLRWDGQEWLVGCSEHGVSVLGQRPQPTEMADALSSDNTYPPFQRGANKAKDSA